MSETSPLRIEAGDRGTRPSRLGQLAATSPELARVVAGNPAATPRMLLRLAQSSDREVREAVCLNPRTPARIVYALAIEMPEVFARSELAATWYRAGVGGAPRANVARQLLARETLPAGWAEALLIHPRPSLRVMLARRGDLSREGERRLVADSSRCVRCAVAEREGLAPELIAALVGDGDPEVRAKIAAHPRLTAEQRAALAADGDHGVRSEVARRGDLPPELAEALYHDRWPWVRYALARNAACPERLLLAFAAEDDRWVDDAVADNPAAPVAALLQVGPRVAARERLSWTRTRLVQHANATEEVVAAVLRAAPPEVRHELVFAARRMSRQTMLELAADPEPRVGHSLSYRADLPAEVLEALYLHPDGLARGGAVRNAGASRSLLGRGARDPSAWVRSQVPEHPHVPPELLELLARDADRYVRVAVAKYTRDPRLIEQMAHDPEDQVIACLVYNKATPPALAARLRDSAAFRRYQSYW
jgi:hypothetical protein